jgi:hypothetical protein
MTIPQTGLPTLCFIHPAVLRGMASTHTPSHTLPPANPDKKEQLLENIKLRVAEVRRRIELMSMEDDVIENVVDKGKQLTSESE